MSLSARTGAPQSNLTFLAPLAPTEHHLPSLRVRGCKWGLCKIPGTLAESIPYGVSSGCTNVSVKVGLGRPDDTKPIDMLDPPSPSPGAHTGAPLSPCMAGLANLTQYPALAYPSPPSVQRVERATTGPHWGTCVLAPEKQTIVPILTLPADSMLIRFPLHPNDDRCRRRSVLDHFGDRTAGQPLGRCCDFCDSESWLPDPETIAVRSRAGPRQRQPHRPSSPPPTAPSSRS
jgi:hypothetical protein